MEGNASHIPFTFYSLLLQVRFGSSFRNSFPALDFSQLRMVIKEPVRFYFYFLSVSHSVEELFCGSAFFASNDGFPRHPLPTAFGLERDRKPMVRCACFFFLYLFLFSFRFFFYLSSFFFFYSFFIPFFFSFDFFFESSLRLFFCYLLFGFFFIFCLSCSFFPALFFISYFGGFERCRSFPFLFFWFVTYFVIL